MREISSIFDNLYNKLLLRDFFAKIIPGMLVLAALFIPVFSDTIAIDRIDIYWIKEINFWIWLFIVGISWLAGFTVQSLGEKLGWIHYYPPDMLMRLNGKPYKEHLMNIQKTMRKLISSKIVADDADTYWLAFINRFDHISSKSQKQKRERLVVIAEACGNMHVAVFVASITYVVRIFSLLICYCIKCCMPEFITKNICTEVLRIICNVPLLLAVVIIFFLLKRMHDVHVERIFKFVMIVLFENKDYSKYDNSKRIK